MNFMSLVQSYMNIFYYVGQILYPIEFYFNKNPKTIPIFKRFILILPTICITIFKFIICIQSFYLFLEDGTSDSVMTIVFLICELVKTFVVLYQNLTYRNLVMEILKNFRTLEIMFKNDLNCPISFDAFRKSYAKKMFIAFSAYIQLILFFAMQYYFSGRTDFHISMILIKIMQLISITIYLHIIFFVELLTYYLMHLNSMMSENCVIPSDRIFIVSKFDAIEVYSLHLAKYKIFHFRMWKINEQINEYFGWSIIAIALQSFIDLCYVVYWQVKVLQINFEIFSILCKFIVILLFCIYTFDQLSCILIVLL